MGPEVWWGVLGGIGAETLKWFRIREQLHDGLPDYATRPPYWIATAAMICVGAY